MEFNETKTNSYLSQQYPPQFPLLPLHPQPAKQRPLSFPQPLEVPPIAPIVNSPETSTISDKSIISNASKLLFINKIF